jgi:hypothetical protein
LKDVSLVALFTLVRRAHNTEGNSLCQFLPLASKSWNILVFIPYMISLLVRSTCPFICGCAADDGWCWIPKSTQHLVNFVHLNCVPLFVRTLLDTPNLYMMLCRNLTTASCVIFTASTTSIHLVNVWIPTNKYLKPPGTLGKMPTMSIPQTAKGQEISIGWSGLAYFVVCFCKN